MAAFEHKDGTWTWGEKGKVTYKSKTEAEKAGIAMLIDRITKAKKKLDQQVKDHK